MKKRTMKQGFSMMELMVTIAISLIALLAMEKAVSIGLNSKRVIAEKLDAESSANLAMALLENEVKSAGYGINSDPFLGCLTKVFIGGNWVSYTLAPVVIQAGAGANGSDVLTFNRSRGDTGFANTNFLSTTPLNGTSFSVANRFNVNIGDQVVMADGGGNCVQLTVSNLAGAQSLTTSRGIPFSVSTLGVMMNTSDGVTGGGLSSRSFSLDASGSRLNKDEILDSTLAQSVAEQIVYLKAFYGKDPGGVMQITTWDQTAPSSAADWKKVLAIRIGLVAKSQAAEAVNGGVGNCTGGNCPTNATVQLWPDEKLTNGDVIAGPVYNVSTSDRAYRHVVKSMIIPVRNNIWNNN